MPKRFMAPSKSISGIILIMKSPWLSTSTKQMVQMAAERQRKTNSFVFDDQTKNTQVWNPDIHRQGCSDSSLAWQSYLLIYHNSGYTPWSRRAVPSWWALLANAVSSTTQISIRDAWNLVVAELGPTRSATKEHCRGRLSSALPWFIYLRRYIDRYR